MIRLEFEYWKDFRSWIDEDRQVMPVYWRGQKDPNWPLASAFERQILRLNGGWRKGESNVYPYNGRFEREGKKTWSPGFYANLRDRYLEAFRRASSGLRGSSPVDLHTDQWWALGRHHGLITPLLDWTESPYIAAFFPLMELFQEMSAGGGGVKFGGNSVAVYRLFHNTALEGDGLRVTRPLIDELVRMHGQRGVFTWLDSETYFELEGFCDHTGRGDLLTKVTLSDQAVMHGQRDLKAHGVDHRTLFPDLSGAAQHANTLWEVY